MSTTPVFGSGDRIDGTLPADLVAQLEGKSAPDQQKLIIQYYQAREQKLKEAAATAMARAVSVPPVPGTPPPAPPIRTTATISTQEFWNDPNKAVKALQEGLITKDEFNAHVGPFQKLAIQVAENIASTGKKHWNRYINEIRAIMAGCAPADQADTSNWNVAYNHVVGQHLDELEREAVTAATRPATEGGQPPPPPAPKVTDLATMKFVGGDPTKPKTAMTVVNGLNIKPEQYIDAMSKIDQGVFPGLTLDNRGR